MLDGPAIHRQCFRIPFFVVQQDSRCYSAFRSGRAGRRDQSGLRRTSISRMARACWCVCKGLSVLAGFCVLERPAVIGVRQLLLETWLAGLDQLLPQGDGVVIAAQR